MSIDVGMKNLAFCILSLENSKKNVNNINNKIEISDNLPTYTTNMWEVVNLCDDQI